MTKEWDRDDYIEEDVRRHTSEINAIVRDTTSNIEKIEAIRDKMKAFDTQLEKRWEKYVDHEDRLRKLEQWKARSLAYWGIVATILTAAMAAVMNMFFPS